MNRKKIEEIVESLATNIVKDLEIEIVDVEYVKEREWYLRVFIDKENGIELDECQMVSEQLESHLDRLDLIKDQYYLEVSSPGLDRQLKKEKDFLRHTGDMVEIKLYRPLNGTKNFVATLIALKDGVIYLKNVASSDNIGKKSKKGRKEKKTGPAVLADELNIPWSEVAGVRLYIDF